MNFCVVGAGAWGTAFAVHLARLGHEVTLVPRRAEQAAAMTVARQNKEYLPGFPLPAELRITADLAAGLEGAEVVLIASPSHALRETAQRLREAHGGASRLRLVVSLVKGLERETYLRPSQVLAEVLPEPKRLDEVTYKVIVAGFPLLSIGIVLGAMWAYEAWGRYWGWDPKETWALITWFVYAIYLHTRVTLGWTGKPGAALAVAGFAVVIFCYMGVNLGLTGEGLHTYGAG